MTGGIVMTLAQLTYFIEIAKTKNFTEAASNLYISQSNISYAIHALEDELDALLFVRRPNKRIELTMYGETLYPYIAEGIRLIEEGKNRVSSMKSPLHGSVRLAFFHSIVFSAVPALMSYFREDNPGNEIEFQTMVFHNWTDFRQLLLDGKCDLVLSAGNLGNGCESVKVAEHHIFSDRSCGSSVCGAGQRIVARTERCASYPDRRKQQYGYAYQRNGKGGGRFSRYKV